MKISLNWLNDFINTNLLPQQGSPEELDVLLTNTGLEVEGIEAHENIPGGLKGFVVGEVLTCEKFEVKDLELNEISETIWIKKSEINLNDIAFDSQRKFFESYL